MKSLDDLESRVGHTGIFYNGKVLLFGGLNLSNQIYVNDLIEIDMLTLKWENNSSHQCNCPNPRNFHSACLRKKLHHDEMIIFGGKSNGFHRDVWVYRFDNASWTLLEAENVISPRYGQSATVYGDYMFVFGGNTDNNLTSNELFAFNFETREWKLVELTVELQRRYHHASVLDEETGDWYILGGKSATDLVNDFVKIKLSTFDKSTCQSEVLIAELDESVQKFGHSLVMENSESGKKLYSIGGCNNMKDHLNCISLDMNAIQEGWKIVENHSLSNIFKNFSECVGPVFHVNVPLFVLNKDNESDLNNFVFGGIYQKTEVPKDENQTTQNTKISKRKILEFNIEIFENVMNDDIFRLVLSYLNIPDLLSLELVSKKLRICKLTTEDQYWKEYYLERIEQYLEASKTYIHNFNVTRGSYESIVLYSDFYSRYLNFNSNYKKHLIKVAEEVMLKVEKDHLRMTRYIKGLEQCGKDVYIPKADILNYKLKNTSNSVLSYKIVQVGDAAVGKTCLWYTLSTNSFPHEYVPTVFDDHSTAYTCDGNTFSLVLCDTAGFEDYGGFRPASYPGTDLFFLSFSCTEESSMENVANKWIAEIRHHCNNTPIVLVCTKVDLRDDPAKTRELLFRFNRKPSSYEQGELLAKKMGCITYLETSSLKATGISDLPEVMIRSISMWNDPSFKDILKKNREKKNCDLQ